MHQEILFKPRLIFIRSKRPSAAISWNIFRWSTTMKSRSSKPSESTPWRRTTRSIALIFSCAICLIDFLPQEQLRQLPCHGAHVFHPSCIDGWLEKSLTCPHCSTSVDAALLLKFVPHSNRPDEDDDDEWDSRESFGNGIVHIGEKICVISLWYSSRDVRVRCF